jgi:hypothetical protein
MRTIVFIFVVMVTPLFAAIGASLDSVKGKYGGMAEIRGDPPSYAFRTGDAVVEIVLTPATISRINVFYAKSPADALETLLERFSGRSGWKRRPIDDVEFEQFPRYGVSTDQFYSAGEVYALVRREFGSSKLMLLIQTPDFLRYSAEVREKRKNP